MVLSVVKKGMMLALRVGGGNLPGMPRGRRAAEAGVIYHVLNRGNDRKRICHKPGDYDACVRLLREGKSHARVALLDYCVMPNHWHLAVQPLGDGELAKYMAWVTNTHAKRYRQHYQSLGDGHVYQGRYKSFPVQDDHHLLVLFRYIESNAARAGLAARAELWPWCGASELVKPSGLLEPWPSERPTDWLELVNEILPPAEMKAVRTSIKRDAPLGSAAWVEATAARLDLTLRPRGRPRKSKTTILIEQDT